MTSADLIRQALAAQGTDDTTLAARSGIDITLIRRYLAGEVRVGVKNARRLASALNLSLEEVLYGAPATDRAS